MPTPARIRSQRAVILTTVIPLANQVAMSLGAAGFRSCVVGPGGWSSVRFSRHCRRYVTVRSQDVEEGSDDFLRRLDEIARGFGADILIPADLPAAQMLARRRGRVATTVFPIPADEDSILRFHHKGRFAALAREAGVLHPETRILKGPEDAFTLDLPYPLIAKPLDRAGGFRVQRVDSRAALLAYLKEGGPGESLVQTFIDGEDIDLSFLADRGRLAAWAVQRREPGNPRLLHFLEDDRLVQSGRALVEASGYNGVAHLDYRIERSTGRAFVLEANPRFWGSLIYSTWAGVNFPLLGIDLALGSAPAAAFRPPVGECDNRGLSPRGFLKALLRGRFVPEGLPRATREAWIHNHRDPLPLVWEKLHSLTQPGR